MLRLCPGQVIREPPCGKGTFGGAKGPGAGRLWIQGLLRMPWITLRAACSGGRTNGELSLAQSSLAHSISQGESRLRVHAGVKMLHSLQGVTFVTNTMGRMNEKEIQANVKGELSPLSRRKD